MAKKKFYAVRKGRDGPNIYENWNDCSRAVNHWPNAEFKGFSTLLEAQEWLGSSLVVQSSYNEESEYYDSSETDEELFEQFTCPTPESQLGVVEPPTPSSEEFTEPEPFTQDYIPFPSSPDPGPQSLHTVSSGSPSSALSPSIALSEEQTKIFDLVMQGKNVFFTGSAGTGKSVLLRKTIEYFRGRNPAAMGVTASTGIAAVNIGGVTLHSWAGIGLGVGTVESLTNKISNNRAVSKRWRTTQILIIDEVSMIDGLLFDKLEQLGRSLRNNQTPFGGIQLVLSGDFCQLPPVPGRDRRVPTFAFEASGWAKCFNEIDNSGSVHRLTKVFRQSDQKFIDMLNALRKGKPDANISSQFLKLSRSLIYNDGIGPCELFPLREQVYEANDSRLRDLPGESRIFTAKDVGGYDAYHRSITDHDATILLNKHSLAVDMITLKVGAQVMLIKNLSQGRLVNGSMGQIVDFKTFEEARKSFISVATVDLESRENIRNDRIGDCGSREEWPLVRFLNGDLTLLTPVPFEVLNVLGGVEATRRQVPLILAWALSIHKSQGQTLERVKVDLDRIFENGQAYVALSRATCLEGLEVQNFHPSKIMANSRVLTFYEELERRTRQSPLQELDEFDSLPDDETIEAYCSMVSDNSTM